ncbi:hypothetical protein ACS0TY_001885 [Phlomoides rotata]
MEAVGTVSESEWNSSFNGTCNEEADFMAQLLGNCSLPNEPPSGLNIALSSSFWPANVSNVNVLGVDESSMYLSDGANSSMFSFSLGSSYIGGNTFLCPSSNHESYFPFVSINNFMTMEGDDFLNQDISNDSIESNEKMSEDVLQGKSLQREIEKDATSPSQMSKKRPQIPTESKRSKKLKTCAKVDENGKDKIINNTKEVLHRQSSSSCCSEDDSNASSREVKRVTSSSSSKGSDALNLSGKTRANRGSATDPQSLYARKRRERINERLRILQNLVPNGTKVDISTMLEEAVQYVKFLQIQIKLLSSDELWMYAPLAYNGMNLRLDFDIPTPNAH